MDGGKRCPDTGVARHLPIAERYIEICTNQYTLADNTSSDIAVIWGKFIAYVVPVSRLLARI